MGENALLITVTDATETYSRVYEITITRVSDMQPPVFKKSTLPASYNGRKPRFGARLFPAIPRYTGDSVVLSWQWYVCDSKKSTTYTSYNDPENAPSGCVALDGETFRNYYVSDAAIGGWVIYGLTLSNFGGSVTKFSPSGRYSASY
jgi:hypothetical protein